MSLRRSTVFILVVIAAAAAIWQQGLGNNMQGFLGFAAVADLEVVFSKGYSEILTAGELVFYRLLGMASPELNPRWMSLWSVVGFLAFPLVFWRIEKATRLPLLLVVAICLSPFLVMSIASGQLAAMWIGCMLASLLCFRDKRYVLSGLLFGVAICFVHFNVLFLLAFLFLVFRHRESLPGVLALLWLPPLLLRFVVFGSELDWFGSGFAITTDFLPMMAKNVGFFLSLGADDAIGKYTALVLLGCAALFWVRRRSPASLVADMWYVSGCLLFAGLFLPHAKQGILAAALPFLFFLAAKSRLAAITSLVLGLGLWLDQHTWLRNLHFGHAYVQSSVGTNRMLWFTPVNLWILIAGFSALIMIVYRLWRRSSHPTQSFAWEDAPDPSAAPLAAFMGALREKWRDIPVFVLTKRDVILLVALVLLGVGFNVVGLGNHDLSSTTQGKSEYKVVFKKKNKIIRGVWLMTNGGLVQPMYKCKRRHRWKPTIEHTAKFAYRWSFLPFNRRCKGKYFLKFTGTRDSRVLEVLTIGRRGQKITPHKVCGRDRCKRAKKNPLFDEYKMVGRLPTIKDGAIYDEFFNFGPGLDSRVWRLRQSVHPFFGRLMIKLSTDTLGLNPFAWRLPGALMGGLLPLIIFFLTREFTGHRLFLSIRRLSTG